MICRMDVDMFFGILIFHLKKRFSMGYSLCMISDFKNGLISRVFRDFGVNFCAEQL